MALPALATQLRDVSFNALDPPLERGLQVGVAAFIDNILEVNTFERTFTATLRTTARWNDPRNYSRLFLCEGAQICAWVTTAPEADCQARVTANSTQLTGRFVDLPGDAQALLWSPDLEMRNFLDPAYNQILSRTLRVYEGGTVERVEQWRAPQPLVRCRCPGVYPLTRASPIAAQMSSSTWTALTMARTHLTSTL